LARQVASLFGVLSLQDEQFRRGLDNARGGLRGMGDSLQSAGRQITGFGSQLTLATAPITAFIGTGLRAASSFDTTFTEISARTGVVGADLERLREQALNWGAATVFSGQQAADAFLQLLTTGMEVEDAITTMDAVLIGAAASGLDLGTTADRLTNILAGMRLEADTSTDIIDRLGRASGVVGGGMGPLMEAMESASGAARTFGIEYDELIPMLAIWSDAGLRGAEAGTALRSMLINMTSDTASTQGAWERLGTSMFDAQGQMRPLDDVLDDINAGLATMTEQEASATLRDLAGSYGLTGLSALLASDGIEAMNEKMAGATSASDIAEAQMGTFEKTVESLMGSVEALQITALTPLMEDILQPLVSDLIEIVNGVREWVNENPELTNTLIMVGGALAIAGPLLVALGMGITFIGAAIGFVLSPIGLLIAGVAALAAAIITDFGGIRTFIETNVIPFLTGLWDAIAEGGLAGGWDFIRQNVIDPLVEQLREYIGSGQLWDDALRLGGSILQAVAEGLWDAAMWVRENIIDPLAENVSQYVESGQLWEDLKRLGEMFLQAIALGVTLAITIASWVFDNVIKPIADAVISYVGSGQLWEDLKSLGGMFLRAISEGIGNVGQWVQTNLVQPISNALPGWLRDILIGGQAVQVNVQTNIPRGESGAPVLPGMQGFQIGTPWTGSGPAGSIAGFVHPEEAVIPPGGMIVRPSPDGLTAEGGGGVQIQQLIINANTEEGGRAAARGFEDEMTMLLGARG
jgi:TP901 family phage tail tape measure protein